jgi:hypothetical protein
MRKLIFLAVLLKLKGLLSSSSNIFLILESDLYSIYFSGVLSFG